MSTVIHREAVVGPDGHIDIAAPELRPGQRVSVTVETEPEAVAAPPEPSLYDLVKDLPGGLMFKTADEVDEYIRQERDSWDR